MSRRSVTGAAPLAALAAPPGAPLWLLAMITFCGTLAMHIFVPALPLAAEDLGAAPGTMQHTISFYVFGLTVGQLIYGPISDRFGRRPVLMLGLALYTVAGLAAALAPDAEALIVARLFQAFGGCAGLVLGRAIVRDTAGLTEAARRLALMNLMVTLGPGLAPLIGGGMAGVFGWRSIFLLLAGFGVITVICAWRLLPETGGAASAQGVRAIIRDYGRLACSPAFLGYAIGGGCATTSMYAFISAAPFIFVHQLGRSNHEIGLYLAVVICGIWLGSVVASRLAGRVEPGRVLICANLLGTAGAMVFLAAVLSGRLSVPVLMGAMLAFTIGAGIAGPSALAKAMSVNPLVVGSASGLYGFAQMGIGGICAALAGIGGDPALAAATVLAAASLIAQAGFWTAHWASRR